MTRFATQRVAVLGLLAIGAAALPLETTYAQAQESNGITVEDSDGADRINYSGKLRMLTQRIAASACAVNSGVAKDQNLETLKSAAAEFDQIVAGLSDGDESLHILAPERSKTLLAEIAAVDAAWRDARGSVDAVLAQGAGMADGAAYIDANNLKLLALTVELAADVNARYADPFETTQSEAMMIDISGRQRMLTQKMAKEACAIWSGHNAEKATEDLQNTMQIFETSMQALRNGMPAAGLGGAPTPEIAAKLDVILGRWAEIKAPLSQIIEGSALEAEQMATLIANLNSELVEINNVVQDYQQFAKDNR